MSIAHYRGMMAIQPHRLDEELEIQAMIQERIASERTVANSKQLEAKDLLARKEARLADELREDGGKLTVGEINGKVGRDPSRLKAWDHYQFCRAEFEAWDGLYDAWKSRGFQLKVLAELWVAQYYTTDSYTAGKKGAASADNERKRSMMRSAHGDKKRDVGDETNRHGRHQRNMIDDATQEKEQPARRRIIE